MEFSIISPRLGKGKSFSNISNLMNLGNVQILHENDKWIICFWRGLYFV